MAHLHPTVLIVNDDDDLGEALNELLRGRYAVELATNGQEALRKLRAGLQPCIILLDLMMPVMDGLEFREEQLRDPDLADIPVVVFSAAVDLHAEADRLRAVAYVQLPTDVAPLLDLLEKHCLK